MPDREKVIANLTCCQDCLCDECNMVHASHNVLDCAVKDQLINDALKLLKEQESLKQKMWNALYAEEDKLENHYVNTDEINKWFVDYRPFLQRGFDIAINVIATHEEGR